jgi:ribonuclease BN (tRNA processing enzyme)
MIMQLIILGSGTAIPVIDRASPSLVLLAGNGPILFDMGPGSLRQFSRIGLNFSDLGHIFLTHFHPDHTADLVHFLFATRNPTVLEKRTPFRIVGPRGLKDFVRGIGKAYGKWLQIPSDLITVEERTTAKRETVKYGNLTVISQPVKHTPQSIAYRIKGPEGLDFVYSGDTGFCEGIVDLALGVDLLILEASFPDGQEAEGHLTPSLAGRVATLAKARRLALLHFYPEVLATDIADQCRKTYNGKLVLCRDLLSLSI